MALENRAILNNLKDLVNGIQHAVSTISVKCLENKLITQDTYEYTLQVNTTKAKNARFLLEDIRSNVERKPGLFEVFVTILEEEPALKDIGESLRVELRQLRQETELHHEAGNSSESGDASMVTSIEETQQQKKVHRRTKYNVTPILTTPITPIGHGKDLKNAMENLHCANLEQKVREAKIQECEAAIEEKETRINNLKIQINQVKQESIELKEEAMKYAATNHELECLLTEKRKKIHLLRGRLSEKEKQEHKADKHTGKLQEQVIKLYTDNSDLLRQISQLNTDIRDIERRREEVQKLLSEAEKESAEFDHLEALYEAQCEQLEERLRHEQRTCQHIHSTLQEKIKKMLKVHRSALCVVLAVVVVFAIIIITFGYCLEDTVNRNIKQCAKTVLSKVMEFLLPSF